jgi:hypothetical protein
MTPDARGGLRSAGPPVARRVSSYDTPATTTISRGVTNSIMPAIYGSRTTITQGPGYVVIRNEMIREVRVVPLDGRPAGRNIRTYMGDPRALGGATLVIETTNFTDKTAMAGRHRQTRACRAVTPVDAGTLRHGSRSPIRRAAQTVHGRVRSTSKPGYEIYEYACHEGNYGLANMLSAARADEKQ